MRAYATLCESTKFYASSQRQLFMRALRARMRKAMRRRLWIELPGPDSTRDVEIWYVISVLFVILCHVTSQYVTLCHITIVRLI